MFMHKIRSKVTMQCQQCALLQDPSAHGFVETKKQINSTQNRMLRWTQIQNPMQVKYNGDKGENNVNTLHKMAAISQTTSCCIRIQFVIGQHWLVYRSGANQARNYHDNQWWNILPVHNRASFGLNELSRRISPQRHTLVALGTLFMKISSTKSGEKVITRTREYQGLKFA